MKIPFDKILLKVLCPLVAIIGVLSIILAISVIISPPARANYAPKPSVENCILLSTGKLTPPPEAAMVVSGSCAAPPCETIPAGFSCIYFGYMPHSQVTTCTDIPESGTPTEPVIPQCSSITCLQGERTETPTSVTCSWINLEIDPVKKSAYDTQLAAAQSTQAVYQESILYGNLQGYCNYVNGVPCVQLPPATFNATASSFSYITGKPLAEVKKLMKKKVKK